VKNATKEAAMAIDITEDELRIKGPELLEKLEEDAGESP
jgi:hypothetical protein